MTHSPELHESQAAGFDGTTLAKAGSKLDELAATLARGKTRRTREKVEAEITAITRKPWVRRVITWQLSGDQPRDLRLTWDIDTAARAALEEEIFGKHVLITDHDDWPAAEVIAGYRSQSEAEFSFRQLKDPHVVSFSPMFHWTEHNIRVHVFTCVLALQIAHLMRLKARRAGLDLSVRELLAELAGIGETILLYQGDRGRPRAHRMLTDTTPHPGQAQRDLRPRPLRTQALTWVIHPTTPRHTPLTSGNKTKINLSRKLGLGHAGRRPLPRARADGDWRTWPTFLVPPDLLEYPRVAASAVSPGPRRLPRAPRPW